MNIFRQIDKIIIQQIILFAIFVVLINSCSSPIMVTIRTEGFTSEGNPAKFAQYKIDTIPIKSDAYGHFLLDSTEFLGDINISGSMLSDEFYFDYHQTLSPRGKIFLRPVFHKPQISRYFRPEEIKMAFNLGDCAFLMPNDSNEYINQDATLYKGYLSIKAAYANNSDSCYNCNCTRELRAITKDNKPITILSPGILMIDVKTDLKTNPIIRSGNYSKVWFRPIYDISPNEVSLFKLNELTGIWEEESIAKMKEKCYHATINDYGYWTLGFRNYIRIHGTVTNPLEEPIEGAAIISGCNKVYTDAEGKYSFIAPVGENNIKCVIEHTLPLIESKEKKVSPNVTGSANNATFTADFVMPVKMVDGLLKDCGSSSSKSMLIASWQGGKSAAYDFAQSFTIPVRLGVPAKLIAANNWETKSQEIEIIPFKKSNIIRDRIIKLNPCDDNISTKDAWHLKKQFNSIYYSESSKDTLNPEVIKILSENDVFIDLIDVKRELANYLKKSKVNSSIDERTAKEINEIEITFNPKLVDPDPRKWSSVGNDSQVYSPVFGDYNNDGFIDIACIAEKASLIKRKDILALLPYYDRYSKATQKILNEAISALQLPRPASEGYEDNEAQFLDRYVVILTSDSLDNYSLAYAGRVAPSRKINAWQWMRETTLKHPEKYELTLINYESGANYSNYRIRKTDSVKFSYDGRKFYASSQITNTELQSDSSRLTFNNRINLKNRNIYISLNINDLEHKSIGKFIIAYPSDKINFDGHLDESFWADGNFTQLSDSTSFSDTTKYNVTVSSAIVEEDLFFAIKMAGVDSLLSSRITMAIDKNQEYIPNIDYDSVKISNYIELMSNDSSQSITYDYSIKFIDDSLSVDEYLMGTDSTLAARNAIASYNNEVLQIEMRVPLNQLKIKNNTLSLALKIMIDDEVIKNADFNWDEKFSWGRIFILEKRNIHSIFDLPINMNRIE